MYLRKRFTDEIFASSPVLAARTDMIPVSDEEAQKILRKELSLAGTDAANGVTDEGEKPVTRFLRKFGTNELFVYTPALAERKDMMPTTEEQADKIRKGLVDYAKTENVNIDINNPPEPIPDEGRVVIDDAPAPAAPAPGNGNDGTVTEPPPNGGVPTAVEASTQGASQEATPPEQLTDAKKEQIAKVNDMDKDQMVAFAKEKYQVNIDKRKSVETIREVVVALIQDNP